MWEVKPKVDWDKGKALSYLLEALKLNDRKDVISMYLGDDVTDEDAFEVLRKLSDDETQGDGVGIVVTKVQANESELFVERYRRSFAIFNQSRKHKHLGRRKKAIFTTDYYCT